MEKFVQIRKRRVGIFIDGNYFRLNSKYYQHTHAVGSRISFKGLSNFVVNSLAEMLDVEDIDLQVITYQYFSGRFSAEDSFHLIDERVSDEEMRAAGVTPNHLTVEGFREKGIDVFLATTTVVQVIDLHLDVAVIVTGDGDFQTLPNTLESRGCKTVVLYWDYDYMRDEKPCQMRGSRSLIDAAWKSIDMYPVIQKGLKENDPVVYGIFGKEPEVKQDNKHYRRLIGTIKSLHKREGVIRSGTTELKFYKDDPLLGVEFSSLEIGKPVTFSKKNNGKHFVAFDLEHYSGKAT
jgi:uncharacterized LabA/DUF88 family protein